MTLSNNFAGLLDFNLLFWMFFHCACCASFYHFMSVRKLQDFGLYGFMLSINDRITKNSSMDHLLTVYIGN